MTTGLWGSVLQAREISTQSVQQAMKTISPHPRLLWPAGAEKEMRVRIESDPIASALYDNIRGQSDILLTTEPIEHVKIGRRLLDKSRTCLKRVTYLSFVYRMTGQKDYLARAEKEMLTAAGFSDWNPSHYLDTGEMTAALAIGYDWLYADLSEETRVKIRKAIVEKGIHPSLNSKERSATWWINARMNWNQVCNGGLTLGALAIAEDEPALAETIIHRAVNAVQNAMDVYLPDGVYPEGPSYWGYGTVYNVLMIAALDTAMKTDFELSDHPGFSKSGSYYLQMTGPTGNFFNYADCGRRGDLNETIFWFAARYNQPEVIWNEIPYLERYNSSTSKNNAAGKGGAFLPMLLIWSKSFDKPQAPKALCWPGRGEKPVAVLRSGWQADATYLAIKGGTPGVNHGHMDVGSFVLDAAGVRWAMDLGSQDYNRLEQMGVKLFDMKQDSDRWKIFRYTNFWHNTLTVNDSLQRVQGVAPMIRYSDSKPNPQAVFDLSNVYQGQLQKAIRSVSLDGRNARVQDDWKAGDKETIVRWSMVTPAEVQIDSPTKATLKKDHKTLAFEVKCPKETKIQTWSTEPRSEWDEPNPDTRIIGFEVTLSAAEELSVTVTLTPGK
jgi:hypothetical protein